MVGALPSTLALSSSVTRCSYPLPAHCRSPWHCSPFTLDGSLIILAFKIQIVAQIAGTVVMRLCHNLRAEVSRNYINE